MYTTKFTCTETVFCVVIKIVYCVVTENFSAYASLWLCFLLAYFTTDKFEGATLATDRTPCFSHCGVPKLVADLLQSLMCICFGAHKVGYVNCQLQF